MLHFQLATKIQSFNITEIYFLLYTMLEEQLSTVRETLSGNFFLSFQLSAIVRLIQS